jgi:hypothetical protein
MVGTILFSLLLNAQSPPPPAALCWIDRGNRPDYGTTEQLHELQQAFRDGTSCQVWGVTWRESSVPRRTSFLLWDGGREELLRVAVEDGVVYWERWRGATKDRILLEDPADGIDLPGYVRGSGPAVVSPEARDLIQQGAKGRFDSAIRTGARR